ncbi:MAG: cytochrome P450 [Myxococcales bacterium]|nr:cytochrome P450 [Myxococcales bacterium]
MSEIYYDPYDFEIDDDPHPVWRRMRDEAPLYRNDKYDFWALSRFDDVEDGLVDWKTYSSARGSVLEMIKNGMEIPPGMVLFEDPPVHGIHRSLLARMFTPRRIEALEPQIRAFCARTLDPLIGSGGFDFIKDLGAQMPMRVIGMLLGIPEQDQEDIRDRIDRGITLEEGEMPDGAKAGGLSAGSEDASMIGNLGNFAEYIAWRRKHPSDDLMTELLQATFVDEKGVERNLEDRELLLYIGLLAGAGNETTTRLIGWTGYLLDRFPEQRRLVAADRSLVRSAIEEILRFEAPSPVQARSVTRDVEYYGTKVPEGSVMLLLNGSANRDQRRFPDPDELDVRRKIDHHLSFGYGIHFCMGAALARLEGQVALEEVLDRWPDWEVDHDKAKRAHTSTVRGWERLPVLV